MKANTCLVARLLMHLPGGPEIVCRIWLDESQEFPEYHAVWSVPSVREGKACWRTVTTEGHDSLSDCLAVASQYIQYTPLPGVDEGEEG